MPLTIFEEPWHSKSSIKRLQSNNYLPLGTLSEANTEFLIFTPKSNSEIVLIKINRNSLELTIQGDGTRSYFCEKKSPDSLYFEIEEELIKTKKERSKFKSGQEIVRYPNTNHWTFVFRRCSFFLFNERYSFA